MIGNSNTTSLEVSAECKEQSTLNASSSNVNVARPPFNQPSRSFSHGPVAILWDIENCPVPSDVRPEDVGGNIRMALRVHPVIKGAVTMFSAYGDFNAFPRRLREGCQRTGVKLIDVPNGRKDAADKAILVDMFLFALDNPPPSSIMLISGDVDFAPALHILGQRGYTVILVIPSGVGVSSALCNAGRFVWDWPSVARGEGFVPPMKSMMPRVGLTEVAGYLMGCNINDNADGNEDEAIVYRGFSQNYYNSRDLAVMSQSLNEYNCSGAVALPLFSTTTSRSLSLPSGINEITSNSAVSNDQNGMDWWVQPGDVNGLKAQLVRLLEFSGGCLPLARLPSEYQKLFGRPLCISDYGAFKLVYLLKKMSDALVVEGKGQKKMVCLRNSKHSPTTPSDPSKKDQKGKGPHKENACCGSSDEFSDDETTGKKPDMNTNVQREIQDPELERFKHELQEILVSYSCRIFIGCFEAIYQQRYKKILDFRRFGVNELEELFEKVRDVVALHEEPVSRRKFLTAILS